MKFIYTKHVETRIKQRNITKDKIVQTILNPDKILPSFNYRFLARKRFKNKMLEVAYRKVKKVFIVITAYWIKEA